MRAPTARSSADSLDCKVLAGRAQRARACRWLSGAPGPAVRRRSCCPAPARGLPAAPSSPLPGAAQRGVTAVQLQPRAASSGYGDQAAGSPRGAPGSARLRVWGQHEADRGRVNRGLAGGVFHDCHNRDAVHHLRPGRVGLVSPVAAWPRQERRPPNKAGNPCPGGVRARASVFNARLRATLLCRNYVARFADRCSYVCQGLPLARNSAICFVLKGGQDRDGPLLAEGRLLSGHEASSSGRWARGGRRIVRRPARLRQPISGPGRPGGLRVRRQVSGRGKPHGRRSA